jgi:hypothetical protein
MVAENRISTTSGPSQSGGTLVETGPRRALIGFFLSGMGLSVVGAAAPVWGLHLLEEFVVISPYFLAIALGLVGGIWPAVLLLRRFGLGSLLTAGTAVQSVSFLLLSLVLTIPDRHLPRLGCLLALGFSQALLNTGVFRAVAPLYRFNPRGSLNLASLLFGLGACLPTLVLAQFPARIGFSALAATGLALLLPLSRARLTPSRLGDPLAYVRDEIRSPKAILIGLVLLFQFACEWTLAGWLPVFLVQRLGRSPASALQFLILFWIGLTAGRFIVQAIGNRLRTVIWLGLLLGSVFLGALLLTNTNNRFGAIWGICMIVIGYAITLPLLARQAGDQMQNAHPDFFHGLYAIATIGGLFFPALVGLLADYWGPSTLIGLPFFLTLAVFVLLGMMLLEKQMTPVLEIRGQR